MTKPQKNETSLSLSFRDVSNLSWAQWQAQLAGNIVGDPLTMLLLGPPGIGKTSIGFDLYERQKALVEKGGSGWTSTRVPGGFNLTRSGRTVFLSEKGLWRAEDTTSSLPEDLAVMFPVKGDDGETRLDALLQHWLARACEPGAWGTVVIDDISASMPAIQASFRKVVLQREAYGHKVSPFVTIMVTGNRRKDASGAQTLPAHFRNATFILEIEPKLDDWLEWYLDQRDQVGNPLPAVTVGFLKYKTEMFSQEPSQADAKGSFATPRSWAAVGKALSWATGLSSRQSLALYQGLVGAGPGSEFAAFLKLQDELVDPKRVLMDPKGAIPNPEAYFKTPDRALAMLTSLAELAARTEDKKLSGKFFPALAWVAQGNGLERAQVAISVFQACGGVVKDEIGRTPREALATPLFTALVAAVQDTFTPGA